MIVQRHLDKLKDEIEAYYQLLSFLVSVDSHKQLPLQSPTNSEKIYVTQEVQCCVKAQLIVMLYNLVESTVCLCLNTIYDEIHDFDLTYSDLSDKMRAIWNDSCRRANMPEKDLDEASKMSIKVRFKELSTNTSGNIDIRKIYEIFDSYGCMIDKSIRENYADSFLTVKNKRNLLAHGNISFCQCGANFVLKDLESIKKDILDFMEIIVRQTILFIEKKEFKR